MNLSVRAIAYIRNERAEALDDNWADVVSVIELASDVPAESLRGLSEFSHIEVCLLYTSPSPRDRTRSRMPSSA